MKILIVRPSSIPMNIKTYNAQELGLAKSLVKKGHVADVVYYTDSSEYTIQEIDIDNEKKVKIHWVPGNKFLHFALFDKKILNRIVLDYDIIQTGEYNQYISYYLLKQNLKPVVIYHGPYFNPKISSRIMTFLFDLIFLKRYLKINPSFISKSNLAEQFLKSKGFLDITTIGVGLDTSALNVNNIETKIRKDKEKRLLYVGNITKGKNILFLLKIMKNINKNKNNVKLYIVGSGPQNYVNKCKKYISNNKLEGVVNLVGKVEQKNISKYYEQSDLFIFPSTREIYGMVMMEAMLFGVPVMTTLHGGSSTVIKNNINGYVINNYDVDEWTKKIIEYLENDSVEIQKNAQKTILNEFVWDELCKKYINVYEEVLNKNAD